MTEIAQAGDLVLRKQVELVTDKQINSGEIEKLVEEMRACLRREEGVGLSAPQIGKSLRVIVVEDIFDISDEQREAYQRQPTEFYELINPGLDVIDNTPIRLMEGCLSIPGKVAGTYRMLVERASVVRVRGMDKHGKVVERMAEGWHARICVVVMQLSRKS